MLQPPRGEGEHLLDPGLLRRAFVQGLAISCVSFGAAFYVLYRGGWEWGTELTDDSLLYRQACSAFWVGLMMGQAFNLLAMRSGTTPVHRKALGGNPLLPLAFVSIVIAFAVVIYLPPVQPVLNTAPFPAETWLIMLAIAPIVWLSDTIYKRLTAPK